MISQRTTCVQCLPSTEMYVYSVMFILWKVAPFGPFLNTCCVCYPYHQLQAHGNTYHIKVTETFWNFQITVIYLFIYIYIWKRHPTFKLLMGKSLPYSLNIKAVTSVSSKAQTGEKTVIMLPHICLTDHIVRSFSWRYQLCSFT